MSLFSVGNLIAIALGTARGSASLRVDKERELYGRRYERKKERERARKRLNLTFVSIALKRSSGVHRYYEF